MSDKTYDNSTLYKCPRQHADTEHFVSPNLGDKSGDATYGKPTNGSWKAGGGSYGDEDGD